jgi:sugar phosphate isomerase/epimerase
MNQRWLKVNLSISNIAWKLENDDELYEYLKEQGFSGIEIAPTRILPKDPYDALQKAKDFAATLKQNYGLVISSIQSIWYGKNEKIFGSEKERRILVNYTKKAINFASSIDCKNLVFGCPRNRVIENDNDINIAVSFFSQLGEYAKLNSTILSIEPNPTIYNTNFINYTKEAFEFVDIVKSNGFKVNIDLGTIIYNDESLQVVTDNIDLVNHIHISEPNLELIKKRKIHNELSNILKRANYQGFVSIEMGKRDNLDEVKETIKYIKDVFI